MAVKGLRFVQLRLHDFHVTRWEQPRAAILQGNSLTRNSAALVRGPAASARRES